MKLALGISLLLFLGAPRVGAQRDFGARASAGRRAESSGLIRTDCAVCPPGASSEGELACAGLDSVNGGCNSSPPVFRDLDCGPEGVTVCGTYQTFSSGGNLRDTDWYRIVVSQPSILHVAVTGEAPTLVGILDGNAGCDAYGVACAQSSSQANCEPVGCDIGVEPGTYWIFVAPSVFSGVPCATPYVLQASCTLSSASAIGLFHCNDSEGHALLSPFAFSLLGTVTATWPVDGSSRFVIQDDTGGVLVIGPEYCGGLSDQVLVTGVFDQSLGPFDWSPGELMFRASSIRVVHSGSAQPDPLVLTPAQVNATFQSDYCEPNESRLVQVRSVLIRDAKGDTLPAGSFFWTEGHYRLVATMDGSYTSLHIAQTANSCSIFNTIVGTPVPTCPVDVSGVLGQDDGSLPYTEGYEIRPRFPLDIVAHCSTSTMATTWARVKAHYR